jgi:hypothetical protein
MAGLYDRLSGDDNLDAHYLQSGLKGYALRPEVTRIAVLNAINSELQTPLSQASVDDLNAIADVIDGKTANQLRDYLHVVDYATVAAHVGAIGDTAWRTALEI